MGGTADRASGYRKHILVRPQSIFVFKEQKEYVAMKKAIRKQRRLYRTKEDDAEVKKTLRYGEF